MKLVKFEQAGRIGQGVLEGDVVHPLAPLASGTAEDATFDLAACPPSELAALRRGARLRVPLADVALAAPVGPACQVICVGINYADHADEVQRQTAAQPTVFLRHPRSLVGPGEAVLRPRDAPSLDYEGELAVVIGQPGRHVAVADALDHVAGYTCFLDGSVREMQRHCLDAGKNFHRSGAIGPWIMTKDEVPDPSTLLLQTRLNGAVVQSASTGSMLHGVAALVAWCSSWTLLRPGDVIATGTPSGIGARRQPPRWLRPGDLVEVAIEGVGTLANPVAQGR